MEKLPSTHDLRNRKLPQRSRERRQRARTTRMQLSIAKRKSRENECCFSDTLRLMCGNLPSGLDGMPVSFNYPIMHLRFPAISDRYLRDGPNGETIKPLCVTLGPENEKNELKLSRWSVNSETVRGTRRIRSKLKSSRICEEAEKEHGERRDSYVAWPEYELHECKNIHSPCRYSAIFGGGIVLAAVGQYAVSNHCRQIFEELHDTSHSSHVQRWIHKEWNGCVQEFRSRNLWNSLEKRNTLNDNKSVYLGLVIWSRKMDDTKQTETISLICVWILQNPYKSMTFSMHSHALSGNRCLDTSKVSCVRGQHFCVFRSGRCFKRCGK